MTNRERDFRIPLLLGMVAAVIGFVTTLPSFILFLDAIPPLAILLLWYAVFFAPLLYFFGKQHWKRKFDHRHVLASGMIYLGFALIAFFPSSAYVNHVTGKEASNLLISTEDGVIFGFIQALTNSFELTRWIVYVAMPFVLWFGGIYLLHPKTMRTALGKALNK